MLPEESHLSYIPRAASEDRASSRTHPYWLHAGLLAATLFTTTLIGARMQSDFDGNLPFMGIEGVFQAFRYDWRNPAALVAGLPFSITLLTILLAHEAGHYIACVRYRLDASLPYFLPAPVLIGTFGAFIRIRSPIYSKSALFDVSAAGPIAGFLFALPALAIGLAFSKVIPGIATAGEIHFGTPGLLWLLERAIFPGVSGADIYLHPMARAAWVGLLATAWNLLPIGQLDGGHVVYAFAGRRHKFLTYLFLGGLVLLTPFWIGWPVWAVLLFFFGRRHPSIYDPDPLGPARAKLAWLLVVIFLLSFTLTPFSER